jgi:O-antigen/teichoic acid export membrane protein
MLMYKAGGRYVEPSRTEQQGTRSVVEGGSTNAERSRAVVVERAREGAQVLTARGLLMRVVSVSFNLLLIAWVTPAQLGLLAVVRAFCFFVDAASGQSIATALVRRPRDPERDEYANLAGLQLTLLLLILLVVAVFPSLVLRLAALDSRWSGWLTLVVATMLAIPFGTGARVRLERSFAYRRLAFIEVSTVLLQNVGLIIFAYFGHFVTGVFIVTCATTLYTCAALYLTSPGPLPRIGFRGVQRVTRRSGGFTLAVWLGTARDQLTVVVITHLLGLHVAGFWAFAMRFGQLLQVGFEGFRRAVLPAAARLSGDLTGLRLLSTNTLTGAALLTLPTAGLLIVGLPLLTTIWPQWADAISIAQLYVLCFAIAGIAGASLEPVAVAVRGPRIALVEPLLAILIGWTGLWLIAPSGGASLPWVIAPMYLVPVLVLYVLTNPAVRPEWHPRLAPLALSLVTSMAVFGIARLLKLPVPLSVTAACVGMLLWLAPMVRWTAIEAAWSTLRGVGTAKRET